MKISIITVVFNGEDTITGAINSVSKQDHDDVEHIIIDGGSTDDTVEVIKRVVGGRAKIISERDDGIYDAMNKGLSYSTGDVIGYLHSDDLLANEKILGEISSIFSNNDIDVIYGNLEYVKRTDLNNIVRYWRAGKFSLSKLKFGWMPPHPTIYVRREIYNRVGLFDKELKISADYDFILRMLKTSGLKIYYHDRTMVKMRLGGISNRSLKSILNKMKEDLAVIRRNSVGGFGVLVCKSLGKVKQFVVR